ncbi:MAG TPA: ferritin-like protein [Chloroflexia bacterium]|jgi:hypothetical protein
MVVKLKSECIQDLDTVQGLQNALQNAIELEHSTIPTYLYAYFSINFAPGFSTDPKSTNYAINEVLWSVVYEEMLHMGLACNLLNAIGGSPQINTEDFIPAYPGPLPCGVETGLTVPLAPFSKDLVKNVFMEIEEPEYLLPPGSTEVTIGMFYNAIAQSFATFNQNFLNGTGPNIFVGDPTRQIDFSQAFGASNLPGPVHDLDTAMAAITLIVDQGEGTSKSPLDPEPLDSTEPLAHYYRFLEAYEGQTIVPDSTKPHGWGFGPPTIDFDSSAAGVLPMIENPKEANYPANSDVQKACHACNQVYMQLLNRLHDGFNGNPPPSAFDYGAKNNVFHLMDNFEAAAKTLIAFKLDDGTNAGPSFEYQPLDS